MSILTKLPALIQKTKTVAQQARGVMRTVRGTAAGTMATSAAGGIAASAGLGYLAGAGGDVEYRVRRRSRGISAREFKTTQRTMKKIIKMYNKLPKRAAKSSGYCEPAGRGKKC